MKEIILLLLFTCTLQEKIKKLREDWQYVKNRGEDPTPQEVASAVAVPVERDAVKTAASPPRLQSGRTQMLL